MRPLFLQRLLLAAAVLPLAFATSSLAQDRPDGARPPMAGHRDPAARAEARAQHLRDALQLRADQEGALHAFLDAARPPQGERDGMRADREAGEHMTTPQRLDQMLAHMDAMHTAMVSRVEATKRFYAQLSPGQQKAFDALGPMVMGHHGMGGDKGGHGRWGGHNHKGGPDRMGGDHEPMGDEQGPPPEPS
jgi:hypothetical protein